MTIDSQQYAALADHSYGRDRHGNAVDLAALVGKATRIEGVDYKILAHSDKPSGYQGTVYQRVSSGEIVVAHRGTEFERQLADDLLKADGGMVVRRDNRQASDAIDLTRIAQAHAREYASDNRTAIPQVTVTGHSLGGTLAQVSAHYFDLKGETFNAYGAASLNIRHPTTGEIYRTGSGGNDVLNHVMGADLVSSGSQHYGQVRTYTNGREIGTLQRHGYDNDRSPWDGRSDLTAAVATMHGGSHDMHNFLPWNGDNRADTSVLADPVARRLATTFDPMLDKFRADIEDRRAGITLVMRDGAGLIQDVRQHFKDPPAPGEPARRERAALQASPEPRTAPDMRNPDHPANSRYQQVLAGVSDCDRAIGRTPDGCSERLAASLTVAGAHLPSIGSVVMSQDGSRAFALDGAAGPVEARRRVHVDIADALQRPVEDSTRDWQANLERMTQSASVNPARQHEASVPRAPLMA